jgi:dTDP-4-dehydrorhamnose 3,5-epimerase
MPFHVEPTVIPGVLVVTPAVARDDRGFFLEAYKQSTFCGFGVDVPFAQVNQSRSRRGTLRGLHYQRAPHAQGKLVRALAGDIFDVAVDIRPESPAFLQWVGVRLSASDHRSLYVPPGCAHGFCVLSAEAEVLYLATSEYAPDHEGGLLWNDPALGITWPVDAPVVSERDRRWVPLAAREPAMSGQRLALAAERPGA